MQGRSNIPGLAAVSALHAIGAGQRGAIPAAHAYESGLIQWERVGESVKAWIAHASHGDTKELRERMLARYSFRATEGRAAEGVEPNRAGAASTTMKSPNGGCFGARAGEAPGKFGG